MKKFLRRLLILLVLLGLLSGGLFLYARYYLSTPAANAETVTVVFPRGTSARMMAEELSRSGVITHPMLWQAIAHATGQARRFKAGEYAFAAGVTPADVLNALSEGKVVIRRFTVPEGRTARQIVESLRLEEVLTGEISESPEEGTLLPDTYHYMYGDTRQSLIDRMQADMKAAVEAAWQARAKELPVKNRQELVTLASIVERETGIASERAQVAAVYINRLRIGMKLQADPTVIYGLEAEKGAALGRALTYDDLRKATPYNTYVINGLPPGPIANPGVASLMATANPAESDALYFVADGSGGHVFARTLEEHNRNVAKWRKVQGGK